MEHIINALREIEIKLIQTKGIDASIAYQIKDELAEIVHKAEFVGRLIKDNKIEGII